VYPSPPFWKTDGNFLPETRTNPCSLALDETVPSVLCEKRWLTLELKAATVSGMPNGIDIR